MNRYMKETIRNSIITIALVLGLFVVFNPVYITTPSGFFVCAEPFGCAGYRDNGFVAKRAHSRLEYSLAMMMVREK